MVVTRELSSSTIRYMSQPLAKLFLKSPVSAPKLRIGVMVDSFELPRAFAAVVEDILSSDFAELSVIVENIEPVAAEAPASLQQKLWRTIKDPYRRRHVLFSAYEGVIEPRLKYENDPLEAQDIRGLVAQVPVLKVLPIRTKFVHRFSEQDLATLRAMNLDVLIRFGFNVLRGEVLEIARFGVWSYHHGDNEFYRGLPPAFWEMAEGNPVTGVILQRLTEELDAGRTLAKAHFTTHSLISKSRNAFGPYWGSEHFVIQKLLELHRDGWAAVQARSTPTPQYKGRRSLYRRPTNADVIKWASSRIVPAVWSRLANRGSIETWKLGLRRITTPLYESSSVAGSSFIWTSAPAGHFWADPCLWERGGKTYVFFEDYDFAKAIGTISCAQVLDDGTLGEAATILDRPYHLSYPLVFEDAGKMFMIPETSEAGRVELYQADEFPWRWSRCSTMLDLPGLDSTPFFANDRWWLFTTPLLGQHHAAITLLFSAPELQGPWTHHPESPVSADVRNARSAGSVIKDNGRLIRVSQDCAAGYGKNLVFSEIVELTTERYRETFIKRVQSETYGTQIGMHTYSRTSGWEVIDAKWLLPKKYVL